MIAPYPSIPFEVGDVLYNGLTPRGYPYNWYDRPDGVSVSKNDAERCAANFRALNWWDKRTPEEMSAVEYLKLVFNNRIQYVHKIECWAGENSIGQPLYEYKNLVKYQSTACITLLEPATLSEYEEYILSKTTSK